VATVLILVIVNAVVGYITVDDTVVVDAAVVDTAFFVDVVVVNMALGYTT
jgi:hypothetical protein